MSAGHQATLELAECRNQFVATQPLLTKPQLLFHVC
jgi:hypothetical protein